MGVCLPMQGTEVQFPIGEDFTCGIATKLVYHNYWSSHAAGPLSHK